jgi:Zn-dependent peptidase ImmA (M78 family)
MLPELTQEEVAARLDGAVDDILARCGSYLPPVNAFEIAEMLGITVALDDCQEGRARYVRIRDRSGMSARPAILLRSDPRRERMQWAVAHEIGEHVAHRVFKELRVDPRQAPPRAREQVANQLAGRLLIPSRWFARDAAACGWDLLELKRRYRTASHELIARRMLECSPKVIITIFDHARITFRRANFAGPAPPPSQTEMDCQRSVHETTKPREMTVGLCTIQCWPVHEGEWKREIIRFELAEFADCL